MLIALSAQQIVMNLQVLTDASVNEYKIYSVSHRHSYILLHRLCHGSRSTTTALEAPILQLVCR